MRRYYTRVCNFYYGNESRFLVKSNKSIPLNGNKNISFDHIEIISRNSKKKICINKINGLSKSLKKLINTDLKKMVDLNKSEVFILSCLAVPILFFGFYPDPLINTIEVSISDLIKVYNFNLMNN